MEWWHTDLPRVAQWRHDENLVIRDRTGHIRVEYGHPHKVEVTVARRYERGCYEVVDVIGELYSDSSNTGLGYGRLLVNTMISYLKVLDDAALYCVVGRMYHVEGYGPPDHAEVREQFFRDHGARKRESGEWTVAVHEMRAVPALVPGQTGRGPVVPAMDQFHLI